MFSVISVLTRESERFDQPTWPPMEVIDVLPIETRFEAVAIVEWPIDIAFVKDESNRSENAPMQILLDPDILFVPADTPKKQL